MLNKSAYLRALADHVEGDKPNNRLLRPILETRIAEVGYLLGALGATFRHACGAIGVLKNVPRTLTPKFILLCILVAILTIMVIL